MLPVFMDLLYARCDLIITDCVIGEMEKLGPRCSIALRIFMTYLSTFSAAALEETETTFSEEGISTEILPEMENETTAPLHQRH